MSLSIASGSGAPRDFKVSILETGSDDEHGLRCNLCDTVKRNFYCVRCVRTGCFVHSSMPYSERFIEIQSKYLRAKINIKYVLEECERLVEKKVKRDSLSAERKLAKERLENINLAIEQRRRSVKEKRQKLQNLKQDITEIKKRVKRYQKQVVKSEKQMDTYKIDLLKDINTYTDKAEALAALRRCWIRQLFMYIFPVGVSYELCEIDDMDALMVDEETEPPFIHRLHILKNTIDLGQSLSHVQDWVSQNREAALTLEPPRNPALRAGGALALGAQLALLLGWALDARPPPGPAPGLRALWAAQPAQPGAGLARRSRRLQAACGALALRAGRAPPPPPGTLAALHHISCAAAGDDPALGRVEAWLDEALAARWAGSGGGGGGGAALLRSDDAEDDAALHLHWPELDEPGGDTDTHCDYPDDY